ncbi:MAG TPA: hypothetical protein DCL41_05625, partial [Bdellovibrionales bacterium]|nr:hypothetical protein [Bdellovibrionales bacterium]
QDEVVRRNREDYQAKESELVKNHHKEIRRLNEQHYQEMERLKQMHDQQMKAMQEASNKAITRRDNKYQNDIDSMKSMYLKQMKNLSQDAARRENLSGSTMKAEKEQSMIQMESRLKQLNEEYQKQLEIKEKNFNQNLELNKQAQEKGLRDQRQELEEAHQKELNDLRADRDQKISELKREFGVYRRATAQEKRHQQILNIQNQQRASNALLSAVQDEREGRVQSEQALREGFSEGLDRIRGRYEESMEKERLANQQGREYLETDVRGRIESKLERLEREKVKLEKDKIRDQAQLNQQKQREIANLRDSFGDNIKDLQRQRDEAVQASNQRNAKDIDKVSEKFEKLMFHQNRDYLQKVEDQNFAHRKDRDMLETTLEGRAKQTEVIANQRVKNIISDTELSKQRIIKNSQENIETLNQAHVEEIRKLRFEFERDKQQAILALKSQAQDREVKHHEQMVQMQAEHKSEIIKLQDEMREMKQQAEMKLKKTVEDLQRAHQVAQEQQEYRHKDKLQSMEHAHTTQMKNLRRRNDEKMDKLAVAMQKKP